MMQHMQPETFVVQKVNGTVNHWAVTRRFKKFSSGCNNHDNQARSSRPKSEDSEAVLQAIDATLAK